MRGPANQREVRLSTGTARLLWITGMKIRAVSDEGKPLSSEFICHVNLDMDGRRYRRLFGPRPPNFARLMTLSQGLEETVLPEGFGLPIFSSDPLTLRSQALNLNEPNGSRRVRIETVVMYEEDTPGKPLKPLVLTAANVQRCEKNIARIKASGVSREDVGADCAVHWNVPPGRQETRSRANGRMELPFDTRVHHILVHAHPYAQWVELFDVTDRKTVFRANVTSLKDRLGVENLQVYSSAVGLPLYKDHEYQMAVLYDNSTKGMIDAMAVFYMLVEDKSFDRVKALANLSAR